MIKKSNPQLLKSSNPKQKLGKLGEQQALKLLQNKGFHFITQNFHSRVGEIDLIFLDKDILVFVEVKTRTDESLGHPEESITKTKIASLKKAAQYFLLKNPQYQNYQLRIDVVAINLKQNSIKHYTEIN